jgi:hypothetical protein
MIKSKIEARERALELAIEWRKALPDSCGTTMNMAKEFATFLLGDADLPEVEPSIEEITAKSIEKLISATNMQSLGAMGIIGSFDKNNKS